MAMILTVLINEIKSFLNTFFITFSVVSRNMQGPYFSYIQRGDCTVLKEYVKEVIYYPLTNVVSNLKPKHNLV